MPPREGVVRCARYALPPTQKRYCGPSEAPRFLREALGGGEADAAREALRRFEALSPYLETIAHEAGREPFDADVVDAYWIGHALLDRPWRDAYAEILRALSNRGMPRSHAERLIRELPRAPLPTHTFHVLFVGVGQVTGHVPTTRANMDACRISWGAVQRVAADTLLVERRPLVWERGLPRLGEAASFEAQRDLALIPTVAPGDVVAIHWGVAVEALSPDRSGAIQRWAAASIASAAEAYAASVTPSTDQPAPSSTR